jgi:hypothetical protein
MFNLEYPVRLIWHESTAHSANSYNIWPPVRAMRFPRRRYVESWSLRRRADAAEPSATKRKVPLEFNVF